MASLLPQLYLDTGSGLKPASGATLAFKVQGSETPKDTYTTAGGGTANANPVVSDSVGVFPPIYIIGDYDWVLHDKNGVQQNSGSVYVDDAGDINYSHGTTGTTIEGALDARRVSYATFSALPTTLAVSEIGDIVYTDCHSVTSSGGGNKFELVDGASSRPAEVSGYVAHVAGGSGYLYWKGLFDGDVLSIQFGARGDGSTDDTAELQAMAAALPTIRPGGGKVVIEGESIINDTLTFSSRIDVRGGKLKAVGINNVSMVTFQADNSSIDDIIIEGNDIAGTYPSAAATSGNGITFQASSGFIQYSHVGNNVHISKVTGTAIYLDHCKNFTVGSPKIFDCGYAGIITISCVDGVIDSPIIQGIRTEGSTIGTTNAYGITCTRPESFDLTADPQSTNIQIGMPIIKDVATWTGIDTHGGANITVEYARVYGCWNAFNTQRDSDTVGLQNPPKRIKFAGYASGSTTLANQGIGVNVSGFDATHQAEDIELNIEIYHCGNSVIANSQNGALRLNNVKGVTGSVKLIDSYKVGLSILGTNDNIDLDISQRGVSFPSGTPLFAYAEPPACTNVRLTGTWKESADEAAATIGILYTTGETSAGNFWLDKLRITLGSGTNYIRDGSATNNTFGDMSWTAESEKMYASGQATAGSVQYDGGSPAWDFTTNFRRIPVDTLGLVPEWSLINQNATHFDYGIRTFANNYKPAVYKFDGTNTAVVTLNILGTQNGLFFVD